MRGATHGEHVAILLHQRSDGVGQVVDHGLHVEAVDLEPTRIYRAADAKQFLQEAELPDDAVIAQIDGRIMSAFVRARKPAAAVKSCCGPTCCS